jgi:hypothetical protein
MALRLEEVSVLVDALFQERAFRLQPEWKEGKLVLGRVPWVWEEKMW